MTDRIDTNELRSLFTSPSQASRTICAAADEIDALRRELGQSRKESLKHPSRDPSVKYRAYRICPDGEAGWLYVRTLAEVSDHIGAGGIEDMWRIETVLMSDDELDALPEFDGW